MEDPLATRRGRFLALAAGLPARCRLVEESEGNPLLRKLRKLTLFGGRYLRWAGARAGFKPGVVEFPLFWGARISLPYSGDSDFTTFYLAGAPGGPEYKLVRWLIRTLKDGDSFYDAGANYGFFTLLAAEFVGAKGEIHAFEPLPEIHSWLLRNTPGPIARIVDAALWDRSGSAPLYRHRLGNALGTLEPAVAASGAATAEVRCVTLDEYAKANRPPTIMKIDVEGGESRLIAGGRETLKTARPTLSMEVWSGTVGERFSLPACRALLELGYAAHELGENGELVALPAERVAAYIAGLPTVWDNLVFLPV